ncbi:MAG: AAA family ATPase [Anaerolineae bacterium]|nr:AAA family ATPase [Anaerolineae bacterium]
MASPDLFDHQRQKLIASEQPLAARMRPRTLDEYIGQDHIVGPGRLLRRAIQADQLSSVIFYGPPGTGKTTLARVIANTTSAHFIALNAVLAGVKDIRESIDAAESQRGLYGRKTILFVDEVHRFNKAQQDALLPHVENGTVVLIGATTENPYFSVNRPLVSRSRIFQLKPLTEDDLYGIARQALADPERGYGKLNVQIDDDALAHLVNVANGDARALLNALELAVETTPPEGGRVRVTKEVAEESIQRRAVLYDKEGDAHFDTISAFIKSVRGSDPDAALYWLAKMVYAGEDPRFIFRRLLVLASEDIGLADPSALPKTVAAAQAYDYVGLPEGRYHLAQATLYLATAPKSNSTLAFFDALAAVERERDSEVPVHLRDGNRDKESLGHGAGYAYPHAYRDHWVAQQYLPTSLQGQVFYQPSASGHEAAIRAEVERRREAQLAAMLEAEPTPEVLTVAPRDGRAAGQRERWLERAVSSRGKRLGELRDALFGLTPLTRHHVVLDLKPGTGLLTWEAVRRTPEGQVWALEPDESAASALDAQASNLPELDRPVVLRTNLASLTAELVGAVRFDAALGRGALAGTREGDLPRVLATLRSVMVAGGGLALAEVDTRRAQRLNALVDMAGEAPGLAERLAAAEESIYAPSGPARGNTLGAAPEKVAELLAGAGFADVQLTRLEFTDTRRLARETVEGWFARGAGRPAFVDHLAGMLGEEELQRVERVFKAQLADQEVRWRTTYYLLKATAG